MTWVDLAVLGVVFLSALVALMRGFTREVLGIGAWVGAGVVAAWAFPFARPHVLAWLGQPDLVDPVTFGGVFVAALVVLLLISHWAAGVIRASALGGLDRTFGLLFGLARGAALIVFVYIAAGLVAPIDHWPPPVLEARTLPLVYQGAVTAVRFLPAGYQPRVYPPPAAPVTTAEQLLHATPQGSALGHAATAPITPAAKD
jgi:membrane protein required for colicin V production